MMAHLQKPICFIAIIASETPRAPLESPELREPPPLLPENFQRRDEYCLGSRAGVMCTCSCLGLGSDRSLRPFQYSEQIQK